jgi:hypothetical protein
MSDPTPNPDAPENTPDPPAPAPQPDEHLGETGKRALEDERRLRRTAEKQARDTAAELEKLRAASMSDQEKAVADAKKAGRDEVLTVANRRIASAALVGEAAGKLVNPALAPKLCDLGSIGVDDDGEPDMKAVKAAIADALKEYPELAVSGARNGFGDAGQGRRGSPANGNDDMNNLLRRAAGRS